MEKVIRLMLHQKLENLLSKEVSGLRLQILEQDERSKAWLARKIKVSPSLLSLMLDGKRTFQETYKNRICSVLNKEYSELF